MPANSQKRAPDYGQWLSKQQVATILDVSTKTVEKFTEEGKLQTAHWRRPSGGPKISVYHPADVEALRKERFPGTTSTFVMPAPAAVSELREAPGKSAKPDGARLVALLQTLLETGSQKLLGTAHSRKPEVPLEHRVYLTVREAAAYLGRPERHVRTLIAEGKLQANKEGHTRVRRLDLEKV